MQSHKEENSAICVHLCSSVVEVIIRTWYQVYQVDDPANGCPYLTIFLAVCYHGSVEALKR
jgi:hypothetical protein